MTNNTFKVMTARAQPYQGYPYVNPRVYEAPSVGPPETASAAGPQPGPSRPATLDVEPERVDSETRQTQSNASDASPYVDETIFYDPFENRRITNPKGSPAEDAPLSEYEVSGDEDEPAAPRFGRRNPNANTDPGSASQNAGTSHRNAACSNDSLHGSGGVSGTAYYTKESGLYGRSPADSLPATIPVENFPEPPPAYSEIDVRQAQPIQQSAAVPQTPVIAQPMPQVITVPTPTVGQDPAALYNPGRKYITCQYCGQRVLSIIKKEPSCFTHFLACFHITCGWLPCAVCVYCTDYFKQSRHYCPNCDLLVGEERLTCGGTVYVQT